MIKGQNAKLLHQKWGKGSKMAFKLSLVGIKDLNHFVLITLGLSAKFQFILEHDACEEISFEELRRSPLRPSCISE